MSTGVSSQRETEALSPRIASLERDAQALSRALAESRRRRLWLFLAVVALVAAISYAFYSLAMQMQSKENLELLKAKAQAQLEQRSDFFAEQAQSLLKSSGPVLQAALAEQLKSDLPLLLQATQAEREQLVENLQAKLKDRLHTHHEKLLARHEELLQAEFPSVRDKKLHDDMMRNLLIAVDKLVEKYYISELRTGLMAMYEKWDEFPPADPGDKTDVPLEDQLVGNLLEVLKYKFSETPAPVEVASP